MAHSPLRNDGVTITGVVGVLCEILAAHATTSLSLPWGGGGSAQMPAARRPFADVTQRPPYRCQSARHGRRPCPRCTSVRRVEHVCSASNAALTAASSVVRSVPAAPVPTATSRSPSLTSSRTKGGEATSHVPNQPVSTKPGQYQSSSATAARRAAYRHASRKLASSQSTQSPPVAPPTKTAVSVSVAVSLCPSPSRTCSAIPGSSGWRHCPVLRTLRRATSASSMWCVRPPPSFQALVAAFHPILLATRKPTNLKLSLLCGLSPAGLG